MSIELIKGKYGEEDNIISFHGHWITLEEIAEILILIRDNEEKINKNGNKTFNYMLYKITQGITIDQLKPFLKKPSEKDKEHFFENMRDIGFNSYEWEQILCDLCFQPLFCNNCKKYVYKQKGVK